MDHGEGGQAEITKWLALANGPAIRLAHTSIHWAQVWSLFVPKELAKQLKYIYGVGGQAEIKK